jgi:nitrate reductase beta subunit
VGRIRYVGVFLYDADRIAAAASVENDREITAAHLDILLDPGDPAIRRDAASQGIPAPTLAAAERSPVYKLAKQWRLALPLHPEFRTLPMVWYIPPLSPLVEYSARSGDDDPVGHLRIPLTYLANLLAAGDEEPVRLALRRLIAVRKYMRARRVDQKNETAVLDDAGLSVQAADDIYRLLALAPFAERYVIPTAAARETATFAAQGSCGYSDIP